MTASTRRARGNRPLASASSRPLLGRGQVRRHQQQVVAGQQRPHRGLARRPGHRRGHVERVGDDHAAEPQLAAQQVDRAPCWRSWPARPGSTAVTSRWPDMTSQPPAPIPAWNGGRSLAVSAARLWPSTGSAGVAVDRGVAVPREVLEGGGHAGRLQAPHRRRDLRRRRPPGRTRTSGSRSPCCRASAITSASGAKSTFTPTAASSVPAARQAASVRSGRPAAPNVIALGSCTIPDRIRVTEPYSWSVATSMSVSRSSVGPSPCEACCSASVRARTCAAPPVAGPDVAHQDHAAEVVLRDQRRGRLRLTSVRSIDGTSTWPTRSASLRPATAAAARSAGPFTAPPSRVAAVARTGHQGQGDRSDRDDGAPGGGSHSSTFTHPVRICRSCRV